MIVRIIKKQQGVKQFARSDEAELFEQLSESDLGSGL